MVFETVKSYRGSSVVGKQTIDMCRRQSPYISRGAFWTGFIFWRMFGCSETWLWFLIGKYNENTGVQGYSGFRSRYLSVFDVFLKVCWTYDIEKRSSMKSIDKHFLGLHTYGKKSASRWRRLKPKQWYYLLPLVKNILDLILEVPWSWVQTPEQKDIKEAWFSRRSVKKFDKSGTSLSSTYTLALQTTPPQTDKSEAAFESSDIIV